MAAILKWGKKENVNTTLLVGTSVSSVQIFIGLDLPILQRKVNKNTSTSVTGRQTEIEIRIVLDTLVYETLRHVKIQLVQVMCRQHSSFNSFFL